MITFQLVSLSGITFDEPVYEVLIPTENGTIAVFEQHMPLISVAAPGVISVRYKQADADDDMEHFAGMGGIVEVDGKTIRLLADDVSSSQEIVEEEAAAALAVAEKLVTNAKDQMALNEAHQLMRRHSVRLQVAKLKKRRHH